LKREDPASSGQETDIPPWVRDFEEENQGFSPAPATVDKYSSSPLPLSDAVPSPSSVSAPPEGTIPAGRTAFPVSERSAGEQNIIPPASGFARPAASLKEKLFRPPLPGVDLLGSLPVNSNAMPRSALEAKGAILMTCLADFGILGELVGIIPGPVVTMFEIRPAPGVRVARIAGLSDDLALALKAVAVRIQAPVPGTDTVGIEIPNETRETVYLRELISSRLFQEASSPLSVALGKDIAGAPAVADLSAMPHLLIAGATGAGKSVGINAIILSFLYKARPEEVKLLLIDPKRVEMAIYADLPHLVHPVVTEVSLAKNALDWAVREMERRYGDMAKAGVRNIADYNKKLASFGPAPPEDLQDLAPFPYLVIIIDELADLMLVGTKEVETSVVRLAQLARAAGIHLILATQRPSVDVVTGLIKANFPCRISFQVTSRHDSRTILDTVGAEHLLGKGDMLFKPGGGKFQRIHGAFVSDDAVRAVTDYWRSRQQPEYKVDFAEGGVPEEEGGTFAGNGEDSAADPLYQEAVAFVRQQGKASVSLVQRRFRIGFNKAARFMEQMEKDGIVGSADGSKPRQVH
jgi:S-DNA-T family DNA segregation ATPase FtsK/SpoIIIE